MGNYSSNSIDYPKASTLHRNSC